MSSTVTFVNIIDVDPARQQELLDLLNEGGAEVFSARPGFISATILASVDRARVINIARWESVDTLKATQADPAAAEYARRTAAIASAAPGVYTVAADTTPGSRTRSSVE